MSNFFESLKDIASSPENYLAIYGAIVGTVALALNFVRYFSVIRSERVKLRLRLRRLKSWAEIVEWEQSISANRAGKFYPLPIYALEVANVGKVRAYIKSVSFKGTDGVQYFSKSHPAHDYTQITIGMMNEDGKIIDPGANTLIEPKSFAVFLFDVGMTRMLNEHVSNIWLRRAFVEDGSGRSWRSNMHLWPFISR